MTKKSPKHDESLSATDFPSKPPDDTVSASDTKTHHLFGTALGPYKLLEQLGEGGMGVVYLAQQDQPVKRRVAIKITKSGIDSQELIARFHAERQALALMDHDNIAKVLDAGTTDDGRLYFVMELVKGVPITSYCDQHRLTTQRRLELFITVCRAIQHAHQKGIVHRDVKPSNILVADADGKPVPKVIDFGLAKALQQQLTPQTLHTRFGQVLGTLEYMSPEQAHFTALDVDTRTDVYSLGVLLYELLTGTTPIGRRRLQSLPLDEVLKVIREEEPSRPSMRLSEYGAELADISARRGTESHRLRDKCRGDLDSIVLKALAKDRNRRYDSAAGLAADIQRYLNDEPIAARPPSAMYLISKFARRHRGIVAGFSAVLVALALGVGFSTFFAYRASAQRKIAQDNFEIALAAEQQASAAAAHAEAQAELAQKQSDLALQTLGDVVYQIQSPLAEIPAARDVRQEMLEQAITGLKRVAENLNERTDSSQTMMTALMDLGDLFFNLGASGDAPESDHRELAEQQFVRAMEIADLRLNEDPNNLERQYEMYTSLSRMGMIYSATGRSEQAFESLLHSAEITAALAAADPREYACSHWKVCFTLSGQYFRAGDLEKALEWTRKGNRLAEEVERQGLELVEPILPELHEELILRGEVFPLLPAVYKDIELALTHRPAIRERLLLDRAKHYIDRQDHAEAAATMQRLLEYKDLQLYTYYTGACRYTSCAELVRNDRPLEELSTAARDLRETYCLAAIALLHQAKDKGELTPRWLGLYFSDPDLDPLREREDFQEFIIELKAES